MPDPGSDTGENYKFAEFGHISNGKAFNMTEV